MSFVIRNLSPAVLGALAAQTGDEAGRAVVDREIFEHEMRMEQAARAQALQRPGEANPPSGPGIYSPGLSPRQPIVRAAPAPRVVGPSGPAAAPRPAPYQPGPQAPPAQHPGGSNLGIVPSTGALGVAAGGRGVGAPGVRPDGTSAATDPLARVREVAGRRRSSGNAGRDAAGTLAGSLDAAALVSLLRPAIEEWPTNPDTKERSIDPRTFAPAEYSAEDRTRASNLVSALDEMADERAVDGTALHSLSDLAKRYDALVASGLPEVVTKGLRAGIERRAQEAAVAVQAAIEAVRSAERNAVVAAGPGGRADPAALSKAKFAAQSKAAAEHGMTRDQLIDAMRFMEARGVRFPDPSAQTYTRTPTPGGGGGETVDFHGQGQGR